MSDCRGPARPEASTGCCAPGPASDASQTDDQSQAPDAYRYGTTPWATGEIETPAGPIRTVATTLTSADALGRLRARLGIGRNSHRIPPGLYAAGCPESASPVLVTANYKLSFDALRSQLGGIDTWILVLDTKGVNVWCAAGKGTFGTKELAERVNATNLRDVVAHRTLVLPQLGAPGVAGPLVPKLCGFSVIYGPVRASDLPAFLEAGMKATPEMRRVTFTLRERLVLTPVELSLLWRPKTLAVIVGLLVLSALGPEGLTLSEFPRRAVLLLGVPLTAMLAGAFVTPVLLPWIPGRAFSLKGALVGAAAAAVLVFGFRATRSVLGGISVFAAVTALSSSAAMNFTGATTFTSPSGVEKEMRRALPLQLGGAVVAVLAFVVPVVASLAAR